MNHQITIKYDGNKPYVHCPECHTESYILGVTKALKVLPYLCALSGVLFIFIGRLVYGMWWFEPDQRELVWKKLRAGFAVQMVDDRLDVFYPKVNPESRDVDSKYNRFNADRTTFDHYLWSNWRQEWIKVELFEIPRRNKEVDR